MDTTTAFAVTYTLLGFRCVTHFERLTDALAFAVRVELDGCTNVSLL